MSNYAIKQDFDVFYRTYRDQVNKALANPQISLDERWSICDKHGEIEYCYNNDNPFKSEEANEIWHHMIDYWHEYRSGSYCAWEDVFGRFYTYVLEAHNLGNLDESLFEEIPEDDWYESDEFKERLDKILMVLYISEGIAEVNYFKNDDNW